MRPQRCSLSSFCAGRAAALAAAITVALLLAACDRAAEAPVVPAPQELPAGGVSATAGITPTAETGLANPASLHCVESGGRLEIRTGADGGQQGFCVFADGSECEEWALYRGECAPGAPGGAPADEVGPLFASNAYGFSLAAPAGWHIDETEANHVIFRRGDYFLYFGFRRADEEVGPFRTGMPAGEFEDGGAAILLGQELPRRLLVLDGNTKVVEYAPGVGVGDLRLFVWLDGDPPAAEYATMDIPDAIVAGADAIVASFALVSGESPEIVLTP